MEERSQKVKSEGHFLSRKLSVEGEGEKRMESTRFGKHQFGAGVAGNENERRSLK